MSDDFLFAQLPYAALAALIVAALARAAAGAPAAENRRAFTLARRAIGAAVCVVALQHVVLLFAPAAVLRWDGQTSRLVLLELVGAAAGVVCAAGIVNELWRQLFAGTEQGPALHRTVTLTIAAIAIASGVAIALGYRWASSWSVVTLTPYVASLASLSPRVDLVASTPFVVRLHLLCGIAAAAALPFTDAASAMLAATRRSLRTTGALAGQRLAIVRSLIDHVSARALRSEAIWQEEER